VPFLYGGVVKEYAWLTDRQFVDAVAVAMITPGPVVITTGFIGFLTSGFWGAVVAAAATFLPCYLLTVIPAPYFKSTANTRRDRVRGWRHRRSRGRDHWRGAGAGPAVHRRSTHCCTVLATAAVLWRFKKLPEPVVVLAAALIGLVVYPLVAHA
jgi:chromate transporter